ncbi:MAG: ribonuclease III [Cyanobacteriota bacterium ELA615]|jgi:ribonuclease III
MNNNDPVRRKQLKSVLQRLGLEDDKSIKWDLLDLALTHPSYSPIENYQQLEFLGDAVVRLISAELLLEEYPLTNVGQFTAIRSVLVSDKTLAQWADALGLEQFLLMSGQSAKDSSGRSSRLAEMFEAILGALYLSTNNMSLIRPWLDSLLKDKSREILKDPALENYKDALQEWSQLNYKRLPEYRVEELSSQQGDPERFQAQVWLNGEILGKGRGQSKKASQQAAARDAFLKINTETWE